MKITEILSCCFKPLANLLSGDTPTIKNYKYKKQQNALYFKMAKKTQYQKMFADMPLSELQFIQLLCENDNKLLVIVSSGLNVERKLWHANTQELVYQLYGSSPYYKVNMHNFEAIRINAVLFKKFRKKYKKYGAHRLDGIPRLREGYDYKWYKEEMNTYVEL